MIIIREDGFTLIEMILVIAILAIITAVAVPSVTFGVKQARLSADKSNAKLIADSIQQIITADNGISRVNFPSPQLYQEDVPDTVTDSIEDLIEAAVAKMQTVPTIAYGENSGSGFYVEIGADTGLKVYTDIDPDAGTESFVELYPNPKGEWKND